LLLESLDLAECLVQRSLPTAAGKRLAPSKNASQNYREFVYRRAGSVLAKVFGVAIARTRSGQIIDGHLRNAYVEVVKRKFYVTLIEHDEGVSVSCPELLGCRSQGANLEEALQNIQDAIREYLEVYGEQDTRCEIREMEVVTA